MNEFSQKLKDSWTQIHNDLKNQQWYQELIQIWSSVDSQKQKWIQIGILIFSGLSLFGFLLYRQYTIFSMRSDISEKKLALSHLKKVTPSSTNQFGFPSSDSPENIWESQIKQVMQNAGIDFSLVELNIGSPEKNSKKLTETPIQIQIAKMNLKQLTSLHHALLQSDKPFKIQKIKIDTLDREGFLQAQMTWVGISKDLL